MTHRFSLAAQRGLSLIELLVAMAIGLIVVGVGASSYINVVTNSRTANVLGQMTENASIALGIIRAQVALAGYSRPVGVVKTNETVGGVVTEVNRMNRAYTGIATAGGTNNFIVGCDRGFTSNTAHELNISQLTCATPGAGVSESDAIAVVYEADTSNTFPTAAGAPTDCLGDTLPVRTEATLQANPVRLASNKFYIQNNNLMCLGNGRDLTTNPLPPTPNDTISGAPQPLVENIYDLQIRYGVAAINTTTGNPNREAIAYLTASDINSIAGTDRWNRVVSAQICIEVRSSTNVPSNEQTTYLNCQGNVVASPAGQLARTFSTTVVLHNRI